MSNKSGSSAAKRSRSRGRQTAQRRYVCAFCSRTYPSSQALAGHSSVHRPRLDFDIFAFTKPDNSQVTLSPSPLNYRRPDDEPHVCRPFHTFRPQELYVSARARADAAAAESSARGSGSGAIPDQAGGSSHEGSSGENPKKQNA